MEKKIMINGMMCAHCTAHVEKALSTLEGWPPSKPTWRASAPQSPSLVR